MVTAVFNTKIESSIDDVEYDLSVVLSLKGFTDGVSYTILSGTGITLKGNLMVVSTRSYGQIVVEVSDGINNANAITTITGFYAKKAEVITNQNYTKTYSTFRNNWASIVPRIID